MSSMKRLLEELASVRVLLNQNPMAMAYGYKIGDQLQLAVEYVADNVNPLSLITRRFDGLVPAAMAAVLEDAFEQLNIDNPQTWWAQLYRENRHRSLSVGDVITVGDRAYACAAVGWSEVPMPATDTTRDYTL